MNTPRQSIHFISLWGTCLSFLIMTCTLMGCGYKQQSEINIVKEKVHAIGAVNIINDARVLLLENTNTASGRLFTRIPLTTNSLKTFGRSAMVGKDRVSITISGLGSYRAGILIFPYEQVPVISNYTMIHSNIYYWCERR